MRVASRSPGRSRPESSSRWQLQFGSGERVQLDVPVVTNCGYYEGLDGPPSAEQCEPESAPAEH